MTFPETPTEEYGDNRPPRYIDVENDRVIHRASSLSRCSRATVIEALQIQSPAAVPDTFQVKFTEGNHIENIMLELWEVACKQNGHWTLANIPLVEDASYRQFEAEWKVATIKGREVVVRCHLDGMGLISNGADSPPTTHIIIEIKGFAESLWKKWVKVAGIAEPELMRKEFAKQFPYYASQMTAQMKAVEETTGLKCGVMFMVARKGGEMSRKKAKGVTGVAGEMIQGWYRGGLHVQEVEARFFSDYPIAPAEIKKRIVKIEGMIAKGAWEASDGVTCDVDMYPCPFYTLHEGDGLKDTAASLDEVTDDAAKFALMGYVNSSEELKRVEARREDYKRQLTEIFKGRPSGAESGDAVKVGAYKVEFVVKPMPESTRKSYVMKYPQVTLLNKSAKNTNGIRKGK